MTFSFSGFGFFVTGFFNPVLFFRLRMYIHTVNNPAFFRKRRAFIKNAVMLSPPIPIREIIAAGRAVIQRIIILTVSVRGRLITGMVIRIARTPPSMALRILNIPPIKVPFSIKLRGMKTGCCSSVLFMAAPPLVLPWKEFPELL